MLRWDRYGFYKKRDGTHYAKLVFLYPVGSAGHIVHSGAFGARNVDALFFTPGWDRYGFNKKAPWQRTLYFCFCIRWDPGHIVHSTTSGVRNVITLFFILGSDRYRFYKKARRDALRRSCIFTSVGICGSHSAFQCIQA
jgi:hypothetical protein